MKKAKRILLALLVMLVSVVPYNSVSAEGGVDISTAIDAKINHNLLGGNVLSHENRQGKLTIDWSISEGTEFNIGDYFEVLFDSELLTLAQKNIEFTGPDNTVEAVCEVDNQLGKMICTFTKDSKESHSHKGGFNHTYTVKEDKIRTDGKPTEIEFKLGNNIETIIVDSNKKPEVDPGVVGKTEAVRKWGTLNLDEPEKGVLINWQVAINEKDTPENELIYGEVTIEDELTPGHEYILDEKGNIVFSEISIHNQNYPSLSSILVESPKVYKTENGFKLQLQLPQHSSGVELYTVTMLYQTRIVDESYIDYSNKIKVKNDYDNSFEASKTVTYENSQWFEKIMDPEFKGKVRIKKMLEGTEISLPDVTFVVINKKTSEVYTRVTTDENGEAIIDIDKNHKNDTFIVKEESAPDYVEFDAEKEYEFSFSEEFGKELKIYNKEKPVNISGTKRWENDQEKFRPEAITVELYADGEKLTDKQVTVTDNWEYTFSNLPRFDENGEEITYQVKEKEVIGYESKVVGYDLVNTLKPITVSGTKTWLDNNNLFRPELITVNLFADGDLFETKEISASDNWKYTFENLPEFNQKGEKIKYTVDEVAVPGYEVIRDGMNLTNQLKPLSISGTKTWVNDNEQFRPESITVSLYANSKKLTEKKVSAKDDWKYTFSNLSQFDEKGKEIKYEIKEIDVKGYESKVVGYDLVNTLKPITVSGTKTWLDNNNPFRPELITINLFADGDLFETKEVSASDNWKYTFENLPEFNQKGEKIKYTVDEVAVPGYEVIRDGMNLTNQLKPLSISGTKTWVNDNEQFRPESITVSLHANGKKLTEKTVTAKDDWKYTFSNLSQFDEKGKEIKYEIKEKDVKGYESKVNKNDITNTLISTSIFGQKIWQDDENLESRPEYITVELYANDLYLTETKVTKETNWNYEFTDLHIYDQNGEEINYTIKEKAVSGYITTYDGLDIINTRNEQFDLIVNKEWVMVDSGAEKAPVTVILSSNKGYEKEVTITEDDNWTYTFENLELFDEKGQEIVYTLIEKDLPGFNSEIIESDEGYTVINTANPIEPDEPEVEEVLGVSRNPQEPEVEAVLAANRLPQTGMGFSNSAKLGFVLLISGIAIVLRKKED